MQLRQQAVEHLFQLGQLFLLFALKIPFVDRHHHGATLGLGEIGDAQVLHFKRNIDIQQHHDDLGKAHGTDAIGHRQLFQLVGNPRLFAHAGGVENLDRRVHPRGAHRDGIPRDARFRPGQQPVRTQYLVDQRRFSRVRTTDHRNLQRLLVAGGKVIFNLGRRLFFGQIDIDQRRVFRLTRGKLGLKGLEHMVKVIDPLTVFRRQPQRLAQTQRPAFQRSGIARAALGLVDPQDHPGAFLAQDIGKHFVGWRDTDPPVDQEQTDIGHLNGALGQAAHPALQAVIGDVFQTRGVDHGKAQIKDLAVAFAQIARHPRLIIDQRQFAPDKAVEQSGFAHIRAANNGKGKAHISRPQITKRLPYTGWRLTESVKLPGGRDDEKQALRQRRSRGRAARNDR